MDDLISRQAARDALCDNCDNVQAVCAHYPCKQYIAVEKLPSAQPIMHDASDDADYISRETMIDAIDSTTWYHQNRNKDIVEGASVKSAAWFKAEDVYKAIENVPTAQQEITEKQVKEYCEKRCLIVLSSDAFHRLKSGRPERCEDCANFNKARLVIPQAERKKGKWIHGIEIAREYLADETIHIEYKDYHCSECGYTVENIRWNVDGELVDKYCTVCGAQMEVEE